LYPKLFFPSFDPAAGTLLSFSTFALAFVVRPIGGLIFGHFGDRVGRKALLVTTVLLMGTATTLIGLLPTYASAGVAAPLLLVFLRVLQGISVGGEYGGAVLMAVEHSEPGRRGYYGSWVQMGSPADAAFLLVSQLPEDDSAVGRSVSGMLGALQPLGSLRPDGRWRADSRGDVSGFAWGRPLLRTDRGQHPPARIGICLLCRQRHRLAGRRSASPDHAGHRLPHRPDIQRLLYRGRLAGR
jgi:MFS family permease